jgi:thioesterase domain-containing protein
MIEVQKGLPGVPPFFYLHGDVGGGGYYVRELARGLGRSQPVYAIQDHGLCGAEMPSSVEAIATDHVRRLREIRASGPVYLGGHCFGAIAALEMARQLSQESDDVVSLFLVEPLVNADAHVVPRPPGVSRLPPERMAIPRVRALWLFAQYCAMLPRYQLPPYAGRAAVFWARDRRPARPTFDQPGARAVLQSLVPRVEMYVCPGTHISALGRHVRSLASAMRRCIRTHGAGLRSGTPGPGAR